MLYHKDGLTGGNQLVVLVKDLRFDFDAIFLHLLNDLQPYGQSVAKVHHMYKFCALTQIQAPLTGHFCTQGGGDETAAQCSVGDPAGKAHIFGADLIHVGGIKVACDTCKGPNVMLCDGFGKIGGMSDLHLIIGNHVVVGDGLLIRGDFIIVGGPLKCNIRRLQTLSPVGTVLLGKGILGR